MKDALCQRWGVGKRQAERIIKQFNLCPVSYTGTQPVFTPGAVASMEARRTRHLLSKAGFAKPSTGGIISVKEAKRLAGRGRGKG